MLIRMTKPIRIRAAQVAGVGLALFASSAMAAGLAQTPGGDHPQVAYVLAGSAAEQPDTIARARAEARSRNAALRVVHTTAEELGVTHMLAARGYATIVTVGVDKRIAI